ncbi:hypothetical protein ACFWU5_16505 [Nocardia sp. NPDC058640]|uniref:hypothetical protein n=1 Tax=Nocardia sp. NPDC058640 TaxID=3346571 RepID=UPI003659EB5C
MTDTGIDLTICAVDLDDARALFAEAMAVISEGQKHDGTLLHATRGGGCATLHTHI